MNSPSERSDAPPVIEVSLLRAHTVAALVTLVLSAVFGTLVALKFNFPDWLGGSAWLTWGRLRYNHTQGIFFGWLGNAFLAFLYHAVPRLADRPVTSRRLGAALFAVWNFAVVLPGWVLVLAGFSQPLEWAEFPLVVDGFVVIAFAMSLAQFALPLLRARISELYVSAWYILGALVFTTLAYPVGNVVPELVAGAGGAAFSGLWIHDAVGVYVTPLVLAMAYYVVPAASGRPIYSHFLSMLGFWLLFFVYPLNGTHHYVYSAIPMAAQKGAIVASVYLGFDVILVVANLLLSLRGESAVAARDVPLRFVWTGIVFYLVVSMQGATQALMPLNRFLHFSDWVVGHSHLAMVGFASFITIGGLTHAWRRTPGVRFNARALGWSYWLLLTGLLVMVADLTAAGLVQAHLWASAAPWLDSVRASRGYWMIRALSAVPIFLAFAALVTALFTGPRVALAPPALAPAPDHDVPVDPALARPSRLLGSAYVVAFGAGIGFFVISFALLGIWPSLALAAEVAATAPPLPDVRTTAIERGRAIYAREGCAYCHTQQVRYLPEDVARFGPPTAPWETELDYPHLWGTRRVGPDLARESGLRPDDWQGVHLFNPRLVVRDSVMPGYPWLFDGDATRPSVDGRALLAYVQSLGQARRVAQVGGSTVNLASAAMLEGTGVTLATRGAEGRAPDVGAPGAEDEAALQSGASLFAANCAGCHGAGGRGDGPAAAALLPRPANLTTAQLAPPRVSEVLWSGVHGSSMPSWRELPLRDLRDLVAYVLALHVPEPVLAPGVTRDEDASSLFARECASCHGADGRGDGVAGRVLAPAPTNFHQKRPDLARAEASIADGVPGSAMPRWRDRLSDADRHRLAEYIRALGEGER